MTKTEHTEDGEVFLSVNEAIGVSDRIFFKCGKYLGYTAKKVNGATHLVVDEIIDVPNRVSGSLKKLLHIKKDTGKKKDLKEKVDDLTGKLGMEVYNQVMGGDSDMGSSEKIEEIAEDIEVYKEEMKSIKTEEREIGEQEKVRSSEFGVRSEKKEGQGEEVEVKVGVKDFEDLLKGARFERASVRVKFVQAVKGLASSDPKVRMTSSHELGNYGGEYATAILEKALRLEKNSRVKAEVLRSLSKSAGEDVIPIFREILSDTGEATHIRTAAMEGLYEIRKEGCIEVLKGYLKDPDPIVRRRAINYLAWLGDRSSAPTIISLLNDRDNHTRKEAVNALGVLRLKSTVVSLIESLLDNDKDVRARAQRVLSSLLGVRPIGRLDASINERIMAVKELKEWWKKRGASLPEILPVKKVREPITHREKKGPPVSDVSQEQEGPRAYPRRVSEDKKEAVTDAIRDCPDGTTIFELGNKFGVAWQSMIHVTREIVEEGRVVKEGNRYMAR